MLRPGSIVVASAGCEIVIWTGCACAGSATSSSIVTAAKNFIGPPYVS